MKYYPNNLSNLLTKQKVMSEDAAARIFYELSCAIQKLHI